MYNNVSGEGVGGVSDDDGSDAGEEGQLDKYRALLQDVDTKHSDKHTDKHDLQMEITWEPGTPTSSHTSIV